MKRRITWLYICFSILLFTMACGTTGPHSTSHTPANKPNPSSGATKDNKSQRADKSSNTSSNQGSAATNQTDQSQSKSTTDSNNTTKTQFGVKIDLAMKDVQKQTNMVLMAPTEPEFKPTVNHLGVQETAKSSDYSVVLLSADKELPINSPVLASPKYEGAIHMIGSFGGTTYSSEKAAQAQLYQAKEGDVAPAYQKPPSISPSKVDLGTGITGMAYDGSSPMVEWKEGKWTLQVRDGSLAQDVQEAKRLVAYLHTHLLPETYGVLGETIAGDGNHTTAAWGYGNTVYSTFSYHDGVQAAQMAASMRVYPSGKIKP